MSYIQNPVQIITRTIVIPNQQIAIDYPVVVGMVNQIVQQKINTAILFLVKKLFRDQTNQLINQGYKNPRITVQGWYEIKTNERGILSLTIGNYTMAFPAAHGLTIIKSLTFDIHTGKAYRLNELFKSGSDYVEVISENIRKQIAEREIPLLGEFKGINPEQDYYIADKALVVYFQQYEITPYYVGLPMFPISVFDLQSILRENGPLGIMAAND